MNPISGIGKVILRNPKLKKAFYDEMHRESNKKCKNLKQKGNGRREKTTK